MATKRGHYKLRILSPTLLTCQQVYTSKLYTTITNNNLQIMIMTHTATTPSEARVYKAIGKDKFEELGRINERHCESVGDHVLLTKNADSIVAFIKKTNSISVQTLELLCERTIDVIEEVLEKIDIDQNHLLHALSAPQVMLAPQKFAFLLGTLTTVGFQEAAVKRGVEWTCSMRCAVDCIDPLLDALKRERNLNYGLEDLVIQSAFLAGIQHDNEVWRNRFYDHPAITPEVYTRGIIESVQLNKRSPTFKWLLARADCADLQAVKQRSKYQGRDNQFRAAIDRALSVAKSWRVRINSPIQQAESVAQPANIVSASKSCANGDVDEYMDRADGCEEIDEHPVSTRRVRYFPVLRG